MTGTRAPRGPGAFGQRTDNEAKYEAASGAEGLVLGRFRAQVVRRASATHPAEVLDAGCGEGHVTAWLGEALPGATFTGIDGREEAVAAFRARNPGARGVVGDLRALSVPDRTFDLVVCTEVLEHVPEPGEVVRELARVCAGTLVATVPHEPLFRGANLLRGRYVRRLGSTPGHRWTWGRRGFDALLAEAFDDRRWFSSFPWQGIVARPRRA